jgi:hypothetical protein
MQRLEVSGAVRPLQWSLGVKGLRAIKVGVVSLYSLRNRLSEHNSVHVLTYSRVAFPIKVVHLLLAKMHTQTPFSFSPTERKKATT